MDQNPARNRITKLVEKVISDTNGISINDTIQLLLGESAVQGDDELTSTVRDFYESLIAFQYGRFELQALLDHPVAQALFQFFKNFPLQYREDHIHLTGSLTASFVWPRLQAILDGPHGAAYLAKIKKVYGQAAERVGSVDDVERMIRLHDLDRFERYLEILLLAKIILVDRQAHYDAAYHIAKTLWQEYNVGRVKLKFTYSRESARSDDRLPLSSLDSEDVVLGLYEGFSAFRREQPGFSFVLSPSFRKEAYFYDHKRFSSKEEHFADQVASIIGLIEKYPFLADHMTEVDTVGDEKEHYAKSHFELMRLGFRKLAFRGFDICSHHGETWQTLKKGIQAVDNAMNIWHIGALEHGLSLGINPNFYFHSLFQRVVDKNGSGVPLDRASDDGREIAGLGWTKNVAIREKLFAGQKINANEIDKFSRIKFHHAREVEHYQHDVLNRMINKGVRLTALPSSNKRLTNAIVGYQDHPFSWWEKKGVRLGVGTDNYVALNTDYIKEMLILLFSDPELKITKLLMVTTGETRRPYLSSLLHAALR